MKREAGGVCSNYLCDLPKGDKVEVTGPFGATFLMPNDPAAHIVMICTGTGSAPFRAFTERRRRAMPQATGKLVLFFGARRPEELPYFGPLQKVPASLLTQHLCYSRVAGEPKTYVQDRLRAEEAAVAALLKEPATHIYICGLKGMESGVDEAFADVCRHAGLDWAALKPEMRGKRALSRRDLLTMDRELARAGEPEALAGGAESGRAGASVRSPLLAEIGAIIRKARAKRGMTRKSLAALSRTSERYLAQIESGEGNPTVLVLDAVAQGLGVTLFDLLPLVERQRAHGPAWRVACAA